MVSITDWLENALEGAPTSGSVRIQGKQFFAQYDIPVSPGEAVTTVDEAVAAADRIGYP